MRSRAILPVALLGLGLNNCWLARNKPVVPPAPIAPLPAATQPADTHPTGELAKVPIEQPPSLPPPDTPAPAQLPVPTLPPKSTARKPPARRPAPPKPDPALVAVTPPVTPPAAPPPRLGEILTDAQRKQYETDFDRSVTQARAAIGRVPGRTLTAAQRESVDRIRTFLQRAEELKPADLATALQLARRAALLGEDLVKSLQ